MKHGAIDKAKAGELLGAAQQTYTVYAPARDSDDVVLAEFSADRGVALEYPNFRLSPKGVLFPQREVLCHYRGEKLDKAPLPEGKTLLFGLRPCDAHAIAAMDKLFGEFGGTRDPYYQSRRENSLVITLACTEPADTCFCSSVGGDPSGARGADVVAYDIGETLLVEAHTRKGGEFLDSQSALLREPGKQELAAKDKATATARQKVADLQFGGLREKLEESFDALAWDEVARTCLGCGLCTYQCPTCHCFDVSDERGEGGGKRIRTWDSCQFALFTHHASGHNPRPSKTQRMRQRILHKFLYAVENVDEVFCVGCGRCVRHCPVNLDIRETLKKLNEVGP